MQRRPGNARLLSPPARLTLGGHPSVPARIELIHQPRSARLTRAFLALLLSWALIPVVFFIPPHGPWVLATFSAGIFLAIRYWRGRYVVRSFEGACPRCGGGLEIKPETRISLPHAMTCYGCHHAPRLEWMEEVLPDAA